MCAFNLVRGQVDGHKEGLACLSLSVYMLYARARLVCSDEMNSRGSGGAGEKMMTKRSRGGGERDRRGGGNRFVSVFLVYVCDACIYTVLIVGSLLRFVWLYIYIYIRDR